jgi:hypothetical protein
LVLTPRFFLPLFAIDTIVLPHSSSLFPISDEERMTTGAREIFRFGTA